MYFRSLVEKHFGFDFLPILGAYYAVFQLGIVPIGGPAVVDAAEEGDADAVHAFVEGYLGVVGRDAGNGLRTVVNDQFVVILFFRQFFLRQKRRLLGRRLFRWRILGWQKQRRQRRRTEIGRFLRSIRRLRMIIIQDRTTAEGGHTALEQFKII